MKSTDIRAAAQQLIKKLPANASWEDLMYQIYVRQAVDAGLADSRAGRVIPHAEVSKRFGLAK